jgi:hypothetical protein|tara:strand:- start:235 stop:882 length:648 start_codon:yes stop_codon:yes gene_type:complete
MSDFVSVYNVVFGTRPYKQPDPNISGLLGIELRQDEPLIDISKVVSAIEEDGVYFFDDFGRFARLDQSEGVAILVARLAVLGRFLGYSNSAEEIVNYSKILSDFNVAPEWHTYGWMIGELPDFDTCHEAWKTKHGVQGLSPPSLPQPNKSPSQQSHIWKLMNDLLKITISEEAYEQTLKGNFKLAVSCLQDKGLRYSESDKKTLRSHLTIIVGSV